MTPAEIAIINHWREAFQYIIELGNGTEYEAVQIAKTALELEKERIT